MPLSVRDHISLSYNLTGKETVLHTVSKKVEKSIKRGF